MRSHLITLYVLLSLVRSNVAKRLGDGMTIGETYVEILEDDGNGFNDLSRELETQLRSTTPPPTPKPEPHCISILNRPNKTFECGEPISLRFDYNESDPRRKPRIGDRIGIYPCYINTTSFKRAEVWQWACGAPPKTPKTCTGPRWKRTVVFNKVPSYNHGGQRWPLTANYNKMLKLVNRCFRAVLVRNDGAPYSHICHSDSFTVNENSKPGCAIRLTSPTDWFKS